LPGRALLQAFTREGFDFRRHPISLLSNGDLGWVQITSFVVNGLLIVASAVGIRRALHPGRGGTWGPLLIGIVGAGTIARRAAARKQRGWMVYSTTTGVVFLASWFAVFAWPDNDAVNVAFAVAVVHGLAWFSLAAARLSTERDY